MLFFKKYKPQISYSQSGEDLIVKHIFENLGVKKPSYLDIGAYHPFHLNNTVIFYLSGSHGINKKTSFLCAGPGEDLKSSNTFGSSTNLSRNAGFSFEALRPPI